MSSLASLVARVRDPIVELRNWLRRRRFPEQGHLQSTGPVDWISHYDGSWSGFILRRRLVWAARALPEKLEHVLEVGYGSGVFQYELAARASHSVGVDVHPAGAEVRERLAADHIRAMLVRGDGTAIPFRSGTFDAVVVLSTLEFVPDPAECLRECLRVLAPNGRLICVRPRQLRWADTAFRLLMGIDPESQFAGGRQRVEVAIVDVLPDATRDRRPAGLPAFLAPYEVIVEQKAGRR